MSVGVRIAQVRRVYQGGEDGLIEEVRHDGCVASA
jgi:hypothetical protein